MKTGNHKPKTLSLFLIVVDSLCVLFSWSLSYFFRFHILIPGNQNVVNSILLLGPVILAITLLYCLHNDLYSDQRYFSWFHQLSSMFKSQFQAVSTFVVGLYFINPARLSRTMLVMYAILIVIVSLSARTIIRSILISMRLKGKNLRLAVLVGHSSGLYEYAHRIINSPGLGLRISGWVDSQGRAQELGVPGIESIEHISREIDYDSIDCLIIGYSADKHSVQNEILEHFNKSVIPVWLIPDLEQALIGYTIEELHGVPLIKFNGNRLSRLGTIGKRFMDVLGGLTGLILFLPLFGLISLLVKLTSRGPVFYGQERISLEGKPFTMWKFRSMYHNAEKKSGVVWAKPGDSRATLIGGFLRRTSMDELPQFWNVLKGEMSLVGPRPERPVLVEKFRQDVPAYMLRHKMKAGLTGWAQVNGWRGNTSLTKRIEYDIYYIQHWSLFFDIKILCLTLIKGFVNENAY